ncbi:MAG TPA: 30S ribosomal protein S18 [Polyangia bacterium]|jgi:small subunit ribosomal protein S18
MAMDREERGDRDGDRDAPKKRSVGRRKQCKFCGDENLKIDYKDAGLLKYFITDRGKLVPRRISGNCAKHQREIAVSVNRARMIALMPFAVTGN